MTAALCALGCSDPPPPVDAATPDSDTPRLDAPGLDTGVDAGGTTTRIAAAAGGTARSADGLFEIIISPGALAEDVEIVIRPVPAAEVPTDVIATEPISTVYSVEPDGLTFGGDGAIVHYHFDTTPTQLARGGSFGAAFAVARARAGGTPEWHSDPSTMHHAGETELFSRLAHLSYQWASHRDEHRDDYFLGVDFDDPHVAQIGDDWSPRIDVQATVDLESAPIRAWRAADSALGIAGEVRDAESPDDAGAFFFGEDPRDRPYHVDTRVEGPLAAARPHVLTRNPRYYCAREGEGFMVVTGYLRASAGEAVRVVRISVSDPEPTRCVERGPVEVSLTGVVPGTREGTAIRVGDTPEVVPRVEARPADTTTTRLGESEWFIRREPTPGTPTVGPDTVTATNNGATMTATRDEVTGLYSTVLDDPSVWNLETITAVSMGGGPVAPRVELMPSPPLRVDFGPVDGLDTEIRAMPDADLHVELRFPGTTQCLGEDARDMVVFRRLDGTTLGLPVREGIALAALYCGRTVDELTGGPFLVDVGTRTTTIVELGDVSARVSVGRSIEIDGRALVAECPVGRTYCTDACVTLDTPVHCGACGTSPPELCDGADNDCDGLIDERCPNGVVVPSSPRSFSDTFGVADGGNSIGAACPTFTVMVGFCGNIDTTTGSIRSLRGQCASLSLETIRTSSPYTFEIRTTPLACAATGGGASGGTPFSHTCAPGEVVDTVSGMAGSDIGRFAFRCARLDVVNMDGLWHIVRGTTATSSTFGTGAGSAFGWTVENDATTGFPGALFGYDLTFAVPGTVHSLRASGAAPYLRVP